MNQPDLDIIVLESSNFGEQANQYVFPTLTIAHRS